MPPPQFSRRHRRWVHHRKVMRCFTDEELVRGLTAVIGSTAEASLPRFLAAAQPAAGLDLAAPFQTWPFPHPMHCPSCDRAITDATGRSLVKIVIEDSIWKCATCP